MGHGTMGHMMGPGMMGPGMMGPGTMPGTAAAQTNLNLSIDDVRGSLEQYLAAMGNPRLKAGHVTATNSNTITVDVVTADKGVLVERYAVDRHTGNWQQVR